ncbi:glycosyltransferase family 4 protein [Halopiger djelfimassiliensis]|uniref:glycosyltransferase family 4 protein n=1 Tax=Halopiger djelfimassiliensis TaxID=1293047 RepID=UPI000677CA50|nr:glycosyltransferase family 4 protein [Halopiger djelfimassiliensis]
MTCSDDSHAILFVTQYYPPETGAASTRVGELTKRWARDGHSVTVLTAAPDYPEGEVYDGYENDWLTREERDGVTVYTTKTIPASNEGFLWRSVKFVWFMLVGTVVGLRYLDPDVVVATSPQPFTGVIGWLIARIRRARFVFEVRDLWPESITAVSDFDNDLVVTGLDLLVEFLYSRADRIAVVSRGFVPAVAATGVDTDDIWVHPNGVDPSFFDRSDDEWQVADPLRGKLADRFVVSYVGTVGRAHGLEVVLDAAERFRGTENVLFVVVGFGAHADRLEREANERGLENVLFVGRRPKTEVPDFLDLTDVSLVHLKDRDLFRSAIPSKLFEALASGTPIALGVRGEAARIVEESETGLVFEPEDDGALAAAVRRLRGDDELYERCRRNARPYVRANYSWDVIATEYRRDIESLVGHAKA